MNTASKPLVSLIVYAYNQEAYIKEAVLSAFSQTYSPLEIIITDDNSDDRTFDIISNLADSYRGPHKIILNRNDVNLGIIAQVNKAALELSSGEVIVGAAGDDISVPHRVSHIVDAWLENNVSAICSNALLMDQHGRIQGKFINKPSVIYDWKTMIRRGNAGVFGAALCWSREVFEVFGPLPSNVRNEDQLIPFRAALLHGTMFLDEPLVHYRQHDNNFSFWVRLKNAPPEEIKNVIRQKIDNDIENYRNWLAAIKQNPPLSNTNVLTHYTNCLESLIHHSMNEKAMLLNDSFLSKLRYLGSTISSNPKLKTTIKQALLTIYPRFYYYLITKP